MHPERNWNRIQKSHPDHLAVGEAVTRAVYPAVENPFAYPELAEAGLAAYKLPWLWLYAGPEERENHFVDVTAHVDAKLDAIHVHVSQHPDVEAMEATVRQGMRTNAVRAGMPAKAAVPRPSTWWPSTDPAPSQASRTKEAPPLPGRERGALRGRPLQPRSAGQAPSGAAATVGSVGDLEPPAGSTVIPSDAAEWIPFGPRQASRVPVRPSGPAIPGRIRPWE